MLLMAVSAPAQAPPGGTLTDQVREAYGELKQYESTVAFTAVRREGRWQIIDEAQTFVAFDRPTSRLAIDTPHFRLVADGTKLRVRADAFPGQHLEVDQPTPLTYGKLAEAWPAINAMPVPDAVFLFAENPINVLSEGSALAATPKLPGPDNPDAPPKLVAQTHTGLMTLTLRDDAKLLKQMRLEAGDAGGAVSGGDGVSVTLQITDVKRDQPIDDDAFAFDTTGSQAVAQLTPPGPGGATSRGGGAASGGGGAASGGGGAASGGGGAASGGGGAASGGGGAASGGGHPLIGKRTPDFVLKDLAGHDWALKDHVDADLLVLGFWASWTPANKDYLPAMRQLAKWGEEQALEIEVVLINCGEKPADIKPILEAHELELPCLLDDFTVSDQYLMQFLPHTVIIGEGVVRYLHGGAHDDYAALLKPELEKLATWIEARRPKPDAEPRPEPKAEQPPPADAEATP